MAFASFSRGYVSGGYTLLSNIFVEEHLPSANGDCVRVYLYGLWLCENSTTADNTIENMAVTLGLTAADVISAFEYWENQGLVQILETEPIEIKYLPIKSNSKKVRSLPRGKYDDFNAKVQSILDGRMVTTTEFHEYYAFMESMHFEPEALLIVIKNCVELKGSVIGYTYILTVAKNLAYLGLNTRAAVAEKFNIDKQNINELQKLIKDLRKKQNPAAGSAKKDFIKHSYDEQKIKEIAKNADENEF
jgi:hypothetical protein